MIAKAPTPERVRRSVAKSISYRILIIISNFVIIFLITHRWDITLSVLIISNISSTILYYLHERFWTRIRWGRDRL